jgi:cytochrome c
MTRAMLAGLLAVGALTAAANPVAAHSPDEVQALVERAAAHFQQYGREQALADFNRPDGGFVIDELYVFCSDSAGIQVANGGNPKLVGKNLFALRDANGTLATLEIYRLGQTKGHGWYEYLWPNAATGHIQRKVSYALRMDDHTVCASGYYKPDEP